MADMASILNRQGARGGSIDERTLMLMTLMQGLGQIGKSATGIADWAMRSKEASRAEEKYEYQKSRRTLEAAMQDLQVARYKQDFEQSQTRFKQEQDDRGVSAEARRLENEYNVKRYNAEIAELDAKPKFPASPAAKMSVAMKTTEAQVNKLMSEGEQGGMPSDIPTALKQSQVQYVTLAEGYAQDIKAETAHLPPEERMKERLRIARETFGAIKGSSNIFFPSIVGSVGAWGEAADKRRSTCG